jgi:hypothetical protein
MSREGRVAYVRAVMAASVVYQLMALDVEPWFLHAVDKLRRGFLWAGKNEANGGNCLVAWDAVCAPKELGGLGLPNLRWMHAALRARWIWLQRTASDKAWSGLPFEVNQDATALFFASVDITVGSGALLSFWEDPWLHGLSVAAIAPAVLGLVRPSCIKRRTVRDAVPLNAWALDITGELSVDAVVQYLKLWNAVASVRLGVGEDSFRWKWTADGVFSVKSAYRAFFHGTTALPGAANIWHSFAPYKHRFHAWLSLRRRCWTADRRLRRGLPSHVLCPLCGTVDETADHISLQCTFSHAIWTGFGRRTGLDLPGPSADSSLTVWWPGASDRLARRDAKRANSAIMLVMRALWVERNARVFEGVVSPVGVVLDRAVEEWNLWLASRRGLARGVS